MFPAFDAAIASLPESAFLRALRQDPAKAMKSDGGGRPTGFRKLAWSQANNRKWVDGFRALSDPGLAHMEVWSPWPKDLEERRGGPHFYLRLDIAQETGSPAPELDWQSIVLGVRHDVLNAVKGQVQTALDLAADMMTAPQSLVFDRSWAERGAYASFIRVNGLEDSYPAMIADWCRTHPHAMVSRFDA